MTIYEKLSHEIYWRIEEFALIKTNHLSSNLSITRREIIRKYSVVAIYALFEGFVVQTIQIYIDEINKMKLEQEQLDIKIISFHLNNACNLFEQRKKEDKKHNLVHELKQFFSSKEIVLSKKIETESNINSKVLNKILKNLNLDVIEEKRINDGLNKLLMYRNSIAHGEVSLKVDNNIIAELAELVTYTMDKIIDRIVFGYENKTFLN